MKKTRFSDEQLVTILREADTKPVPDVAKKHGVSGPERRPPRHVAVKPAKSACITASTVTDIRKLVMET